MGWDKETLEIKFRSWSKPLGVSEDERCENARRIISETLRDADELERYSIDVFAQGSFRNNTNIVGESDVDICALCTSSIFPDPTGVIPTTKEEVGLGPPSFTYRQYKDDLYAVLRRRFGSDCVRGDKAIQIHANSYRIDADVIACLEGRKYSWPNLDYLVGTAFYPDAGPAVVFNCARQHTENGISKNLATGKRFEICREDSRKSLREDLPRPHGDLPSFLVECLAYVSAALTPYWRG